VAILALVLNEMVSNAMKHGMKGIPGGKVSVRGYEERGQIVVEVLDTGAGPAELVEEESGEGLGLSLIRNLIGDLKGHFTLRRTDEVPPRTCAEVRFPREPHPS
jgi:two-component sensor histidine kinase